MSFVPLEGEDVAWAQPPKEPGDIVKDAIKKEQMIKCVASPTYYSAYPFTFMESSGK